MPRHLMEHPEPHLIVRLGPGEEPSWDWRRGPFSSLSATEAETSIVCLAEGVPAEVKREGPFALVEVAGPLAFGAIGVLAEILDPLVGAGISVLAFSTFDTDWILVPTDLMEDAGRAWRKAGLVLTPTLLTGGSGA